MAEQITFSSIFSHHRSRAAQAAWTAACIVSLTQLDTPAARAGNQAGAASQAGTASTSKPASATGTTSAASSTSAHPASVSPAPANKAATAAKPATSAPVVAAAPAVTAASAASIAAGQRVFARCSSCHQIGGNVGAAFGPQLTGIVGRPAAATHDFAYSAAMKGSHLVWTEQNLAAFIRSPDKVVPGTRMRFWGLSDERDIANLIAYLRSVK